MKDKIEKLFDARIEQLYSAIENAGDKKEYDMWEQCLEEIKKMKKLILENI